VLFAFDAFISVLHDDTPSVRADELNLRFPSPEFMFMATSEVEWVEAQQTRGNDAAASFPVSLTLSSLICNVEHPVPLPDTLMGRFVLLHGDSTTSHPYLCQSNEISGILQHAWRTKRVLLDIAPAMSDPALKSYMKAKESAIHNSLRKWRVGWPDSLLDFEPFSECPSLYQDRADACWYLAGIVILPHVVIAPLSTPITEHAGVLSIQQTLEHLMVLSDQDMLHSVGQDFEATYRLVTGHDPANLKNGALGTLIYREPDTAMAGFDE